MHGSKHIRFAILFALIAGAVAADAAAIVRPVPEPGDYVFWTHNGRTYRLPAVPMDTGAGGSGGGAASGLRPAPPPTPLTTAMRNFATRPVADGFSGLTILIGGVVLMVGAAAAVTYGVHRYRLARGTSGTVMVTATGLIVSIDDASKKGTGLITLNRRERSSAIQRAVDAPPVLPVDGDDLPPVGDETASDAGNVDAESGTADEFAEATVDDGATEPADEDDGSVFEVLENDDGDSDVRVVSDRIREKHRSGGTRRYISEES